MALNKLSKYSEPNFPSVNEDNNNTYEIGLLRDLSQFKIYKALKRDKLMTWELTPTQTPHTHLLII